MENQENEQFSQEDELDNLKARADRLGVKFHPSISVEKLREKIAAKMNEDTEDEPVVSKNTEETEGQKRRRVRDDAMKLIRVVVTCNNPAKRELDGEIFTVGNQAVGTLKKFVPFNVEEGWHIPQIMLNMLRERQCQIFVTKKVKGVEVNEGKMIKEFSIEILDPLTHDELKELERRQAMAAGKD